VSDRKTVKVKAHTRSKPTIEDGVHMKKMQAAEGGRFRYDTDRWKGENKMRRISKTEARRLFSKSFQEGASQASEELWWRKAHARAKERGVGGAWYNRGSGGNDLQITYLGP